MNKCVRLSLYLSVYSCRLNVCVLRAASPQTHLLRPLCVHYNKTEDQARQCTGAQRCTALISIAEYTVSVRSESVYRVHRGRRGRVIYRCRTFSIMRGSPGDLRMPCGTIWLERGSDSPRRARRERALQRHYGQNMGTAECCNMQGAERSICSSTCVLHVSSSRSLAMLAKVAVGAVNRLRVNIAG